MRFYRLGLTNEFASYSAASSFFELLTLAKGFTAGPFKAVPSGANCDP